MEVTWIEEVQKRLPLLNILGNKVRLSILYLMKDLNENISYNNLAKKLHISRPNLAYHIDLLRNNELIEKIIRLEHKVGKSFSFYSLTRKGRQILDSLEGEFHLDLNKENTIIDKTRTDSLILIIENDNSDENRIQAFKDLNLLKISTEKYFELLENLLISDDNELIRIEAAKVIIDRNISIEKFC